MTFQEEEMTMKASDSATKDSPISGKVDRRPTASGKSKAVCYWGGKAYSPGSEIKKGKRTYVCCNDGTWGWIETE